ncbi:MAG: hypothetical protein O7J95_01520 [Planctomycetota bacterium]|nr:hypothetical protein [Planctomycetota bacterium]
MPSLSRAASVLFIAFLASGLTACWGGPRSYTIKVSQAWPPGELPAMEVDLVTVTAHELEQDLWGEFSVRSYFKPDTHEDKLRNLYRDKKFSLRFDDDHPGPHTVPGSDPLWDRRLDENADHVVVLANIPMNWEGSPDKDPRRLVLPLHSKYWESSEIELRLTEIKIELRTPQLVVDE